MNLITKKFNLKNMQASRDIIDVYNKIYQVIPMDHVEFKACLQKYIDSI